MSMCDSKKNQIYENVEVVDQKGNKALVSKKVIQRLYPCRQQVIDRRDNWVKFGKAKNIERGKNEKGMLTISGPMNFITD